MPDPRKIKTPGVYVPEKMIFPNSVIQVSTAVPVFIGYTQKANDGKQSLLNKATRITSLKQYVQFFGSGQGVLLKFAITAAPTSWPVPNAPHVTINGGEQAVQANAPSFYLYNAIRLFFQNGGLACYIVAVGNYHETILLEHFKTGLSILLDQAEPSLLVMPDALLLPHDDFYALVQLALQQCKEMGSIFYLVDVWGGSTMADVNVIGSGSPLDVITDFRTNIGADALSYGAAYFPWLNTSVVSADEITFANLPDLDTYIETDASHQAAYHAVKTALLNAAYALLREDNAMHNEATIAAVQQAHLALLAVSLNYKQLIAAATAAANVQPAAGALAGVYVSNDLSKEVWKAPANVNLAGVIKPTLYITDAVQQILNVSTADGKSVNAIRTFPGRGVLVWGARTLNGNSNEWRYISVKRTVMMIEQSAKQALLPYALQPNNADTWMKVKDMMYNFLLGLWKQGAFVGTSPTDAFHVSVGLGTTMTAADISNGVLMLELMVAVTRPAEFIYIRIKQQMQKP
ncbi:phage tail sheath C-terminal domain-containing protein [Mucilaginibacter sp. PAMB04274]|uniref:phage tail sheath family protein n=1 Tax=Mucilaginibacter sp. PAMB04274 TaxID=3138568 RepID=UPI0031F5F9D8